MDNSVFDKFYLGLLDGEWCCNKCHKVISDTLEFPTIEECPYCKEQKEDKDGSNQ